MTEQPIEHLLDDLDARLAKHPDCDFCKLATLLSKELRQRVEREQMLWAFVDGCRCQRNRPVRDLTEEGRMNGQRLEREQQSDVEAAMVELRKMFPKYETVITRKAGWKWSRCTVSLFSEKLPHGSASFEEFTLQEAMAAVRKWKEASK